MTDGGQGAWDVIKQQGSCFWEWKGKWGKVGSVTQPHLASAWGLQVAGQV